MQETDTDKPFLFIHLCLVAALLLARLLSAGELSAASTGGALLYLSLVLLPAALKPGVVRAAAAAAALAASVAVVLATPEGPYLWPVAFARALEAAASARGAAADGGAALDRPRPVRKPLALAAAAGVALAPALLLSGPALAYYLLDAGLAGLAYGYVAAAEARARGAEGQAEALEADNQDLRRRLAQRDGWDDQREYAVKLEERDRIAQALHDELGHTLAGSIVQLQAARVLLDSDPAAAGPLVDRTADALGRGMQAIRTSLRSLKPPAGELGLQRLKRALAEFESATGLAAGCSVDGSPEAISPRLWPVIAANLREAMTNTLKHSGAASLALRITVLNRLVKVEVRDDGRGAAAVRPGIGLAGMEERTRAAGGTLVVDGSAGFSVIMLFGKEG